MRPTIPLLLLGALGCSNPQALATTTTTSPATDIYRSYRTWDAATAHSTVLDHKETSLRTLRGHTQLKDGSWLMEQATLDARGQLVHAEIDRGGPCDDHPTHIAIDAQRGTVELSAPSLYKRWSVPTDLPWVPVGLSIHTPVAMTIAHNSAQSARAARLVDLEHFTSATIMSDQLLVSDIQQTVVLGDDYAEMDGDLPARVHLAAFDHDLDTHEPDLSAAWAKLRCQDSREGTAL